MVATNYVIVSGAPFCAVLPPPRGSNRPALAQGGGARLQLGQPDSTSRQSTIAGAAETTEVHVCRGGIDENGLGQYELIVGHSWTGPSISESEGGEDNEEAGKRSCLPRIKSGEAPCSTQKSTKNENQNVFRADEVVNVSDFEFSSSEEEDDDSTQLPTARDSTSTLVKQALKQLQDENKALREKVAALQRQGNRATAKLATAARSVKRFRQEAAKARARAKTEIAEAKTKNVGLAKALQVARRKIRLVQRSKSWVGKRAMYKQLQVARKAAVTAQQESAAAVRISAHLKVELKKRATDHAALAEVPSAALSAESTTKQEVVPTSGDHAAQNRLQTAQLEKSVAEVQQSTSTRATSAQATRVSSVAELQHIETDVDARRKRVKKFIAAKEGEPFAVGGSRTKWTDVDTMDQLKNDLNNNSDAAIALMVKKQWTPWTRLTRCIYFQPSSGRDLDGHPVGSGHLGTTIYRYAETHYPKALPALEKMAEAIMILAK